ncbi:NAD(P)-dependent alcohol dehydrogenase [Pelagibacterium halotolerans]|uniref:NAD(P)-dependent alcohol dehydrogenase n=1 Tax=Pelagibacterium halotolerans TaxID=531813 RepID=UPI00384B3C9C
MKALVLERVRALSLRDIDIPSELGPDDVRIAIDTVGICGSDVHYFTHGRIGPYVVNEPMVLGHEAAGTIIETGSAVTTLKPGDRVCMEPGIPDPNSRATRLGIYNVDPAVSFWATPPVHGCLAPEVVHPAAFTFKLPDNVSFAEGAMIEPLAVGMQAAIKAGITPGDTALVTGAGPIGIMTALAALAGGCAKVFISDLQDEKLEIAGRYPGMIPVNIKTQDLKKTIDEATGDWGLDVIFEASGSPKAFENLFTLVRPAGTVVLVGMPVEPVAIDVVGAQAREIRIETVFRYAHVFDRALDLIASGKIDLKPLISETFPFEDAITAFERAAEGRPGDVKLQIKVG